MGELRHVEFGEHREHHCDHDHEHHHHDVGPNEELVNYINFVAQQLDVYNHKVAAITHREHLLHN